MERSALVVGVTGMVGRPLAQALLDDGWTVHGAARFREPSQREAVADLGVQPYAYDVTKDNPAALPDVDAVFLEVWDPSDSALTWPINFYGIGRIVERYAETADIVNGCTINVYGDQPGAPAEDAPCRPTGDYGRSRYAQERLIDYFCVRGGKRGIHVRYAHANTASRGMVRRVAESVLAGSSLGPNPDAKVQFIALEDFVRVTLESLDHAASPPTAVNCCHPRVWTQRSLAEFVHARLGRGAVVFDRERGGEEHSVIADTRRMVEWFGEPRVSLDDVVDRVVAALP
jgi:nucleoside-diphosphate-sugar epimerase